MKVHFNSEEKKIDHGETIASLLDKVGIKDQKGIAVAVNETICPKDDWSNYILSNEDKVTLIMATAGG
jgi:sulfur carrier protein